MCMYVCMCMCVCVSLPVISSESSLSIDGKFECNFEPSSMLLLLFSLFLSGCFWVRKECRARWKAACAQAERTVYTWKSEATARQRTTTMSTTTRDCQLLQARQTDRHDWQALCTFFSESFFFAVAFPASKSFGDMFMYKKCIWILHKILFQAINPWLPKCFSICCCAPIPTHTYTDIGPRYTCNLFASALICVWKCAH